MNLTKYYTVHEVAQSTGLNPDTIYRALQRGELTGLKTSTAKKARWRITAQAVDEWMNHAA